MVDERQRVIRQLLISLHRIGIDAEQGFTATFIPGQGWTFEQDDGGTSGSSSSSREVSDEASSKSVRPQGR